MKKLFAMMLAACLLIPAAGLAETPSLPLDLSAGMPLRESCYLDKNTYEDPTIRMEVTTGRAFDTPYWRADVTIGHPTQLRTMPARSFDSSARIQGKQLSLRANAVLAIDGDYYWIDAERRGRCVLRQGTLYSKRLIGKSDILTIDEDGNFRIAVKAQEEDVAEVIGGKRIYNALCFGPALIVDGAVCRIEPDEYVASEKPRARIALCQKGPLQYTVVCCGGPSARSKGMTLQEFADTLGEMALLQAYNLDGGNSAMMFTGGRMINVNSSIRSLSDIVYFASAWDGGETAK